MRTNQIDGPPDEGTQTRAGGVVYDGFCIHFDHHPCPDKTPAYGRGVTLEMATDYLRTVQPDAVQLHAVGTHGYTACQPGASGVGTPVPGLHGDPLGIWREACDQTGVRFGLYVSTLGLGRLANRQGGPYPILTRDGRRLDHFACPNSRYLDDLLLPFLTDLMQRYRPAQIWMDGPGIPWNHADECVCEHCLSYHREHYGDELHMAPQTLADWDRIADFNDRTLQRMYRRICDTVHVQDASTAVALNFVGVFPDGRTPLYPGIGWLSADCVNDGDWRRSVLNANFLGSSDVPADIMVYEHIVTWDEDGTAFQRERSPAHTRAELGAILAHGLRVHYWQNPHPDGSVTHQQAEVAASFARFTRARQAACIDSQSLAEVAIVYNSGCPDDEAVARNDAFTDAFRSVYAASIPVDLVRDDRLPAHPDLYQIAIVTGASRLSSALVDRLTALASRGGSVLVVLHTDDSPSPPWMASIPGARVISVERLGETVARLLGASPLVELSTTANIGVVLNKKGHDLFLHLLNVDLSANPEIVGDERFRSDVPVADLQVTLRTGASCDSARLIPGDRPLSATRQSDGRLQIEIPPFIDHVIIQIPGDGDRSL